MYYRLFSQPSVIHFLLSASASYCQTQPLNMFVRLNADLRFVLSYIKNPLLLKGKKFDVRSYLLIACTAPYVVFFRHGYVRLTCDLYDPTSKNLSAHLTNQVDP